MSINLTLHDGEDGPQIDLWQTPTWVTWVCLSYDPETEIPDGNHEGVRRRYIEWVKGHLDGVYPGVEELEWERERIHDHVEDVNSVENPHFSFI
jgi:hypothetical protein